MPIGKRWRDLDRSTVGQAPERWGVYELGDGGDVVEVGAGVLRDELKDALAYRSATAVRWQTADSRAHAEELAAEHRERLDGD